MTRLIILLSISLIIIVSTISALAQPNLIGVQNVVTVPPNCPVGQNWINDQCRDVWIRSDPDLYNVVTVPPNCPSGQEWINGQCRDVWKLLREIFGGQRFSNEPNCPSGQSYLSGKCRKNVRLWNGDFYDFEYKNPIDKDETDKSAPQNERNIRSADEEKAEIRNRNIITIPNQCPNGTKPDSLGYCRPVFD